MPASKYSVLSLHVKKQKVKKLLSCFLQLTGALETMQESKLPAKPEIHILWRKHQLLARVGSGV